MDVHLRAQLPEDLPWLTGGESPFDDFGLPGARRNPASPRLEEAGALTVVADDGEVAGEASWHWNHWGPNSGSRCPMIGIWLRPSHRGRGIGTRTQAQVAELFFRHTTTNRVEAATDVENIAEQRALEAAGFSREGRIRGSQWRRGSHHDGFLYAVLRDDPRPAAAERS